MYIRIYVCMHVYINVYTWLYLLYRCSCDAVISFTEFGSSDLAIFPFGWVHGMPTYMLMFLSLSRAYFVGNRYVLIFLSIFMFVWLTDEFLTWCVYIYVSIIARDFPYIYADVFKSYFYLAHIYVRNRWCLIDLNHMYVCARVQNSFFEHKMLNLYPAPSNDAFMLLYIYIHTSYIQT